MTDGKRATGVMTGLALGDALGFPTEFSTVARTRPPSAPGGKCRWLAGAYLGAEAWPAQWAGRIEYGEELRALGGLWDDAGAGGGDGSGGGG
jgi:hypothetical protein